jgi:hypothetical protein
MDCANIVHYTNFAVLKMGYNVTNAKLDVDSNTKIPTMSLVDIDTDIETLCVAMVILWQSHLHNYCETTLCMTQPALY